PRTMRISNSPGLIAQAKNWGQLAGLAIILFPGFLPMASVWPSGVGTYPREMLIFTCSIWQAVLSSVSPSIRRWIYFRTGRLMAAASYGHHFEREWETFTRRRRTAPGRIRRCSDQIFRSTPLIGQKTSVSFFIWKSLSRRRRIYGCYRWKTVSPGPG